MSIDDYKPGDTGKMLAGKGICSVILETIRESPFNALKRIYTFRYAEGETHKPFAANKDGVFQTGEGNVRKCFRRDCDI